MKSYTATDNDASTRLSRFVARVAPRLPNAALHKAFRNRRIKVNGKRAWPDTCLCAGDLVELYLNDAVFEAAKTDSASPDKPPAHGEPLYEIEYEDGLLAVLYKPAGVLCHSDATGDATLLDAYTAALIQRGEYLPRQENTFAPALCNRLDRGTEGLVLVAKSAAALRGVNAAIRAGLLHKEYLCVCLGHPPTGEREAFLTRDKTAKTAQVGLHPKPGAKAIKTGIWPLEKAGDFTLCRVVLFTGRTHQIRAHMAFFGAPLAGDAKYGKGAASRLPGMANQALCAYTLRFAGNLPDDCPLPALAGKTFTATHARLPRCWQAYSSSVSSKETRKIVPSGKASPSGTSKE